MDVVPTAAPRLKPLATNVPTQATVGGDKTPSGDRSQGGSQTGSQPHEVFSVDGTGRVSAAGGLDTGAEGVVVAGGRLVSKGATVLEQRRAIRDGGSVDADSGGEGGGGGGEGVEVDADLGTFFEVPDDGIEGSANVLRIKVCCGFVCFFGRWGMQWL